MWAVDVRQAEVNIRVIDILKSPLLVPPFESVRPKSAFDLENVYAASMRELLVKLVLNNICSES